MNSPSDPDSLHLFASVLIASLSLSGSTREVSWVAKAGDHSDILLKRLYSLIIRKSATFYMLEEERDRERQKDRDRDREKYYFPGKKMRPNKYISFVFEHTKVVSMQSTKTALQRHRVLLQPLLYLTPLTSSRFGALAIVTTLWGQHLLLPVSCSLPDFSRLLLLHFYYNYD